MQILLGSGFVLALVLAPALAAGRAAALMPAVDSSTQDKAESQAIKALKKALKTDDQAKLEAAIDGILPFDSEKVAQVLIATWERIESEIRTRSEERDEMRREYDAILSGQEQTQKRVLQRPAQERWLQLKDLITKHREAIDARRVLLELVGEKIRKLRDPKAARWLLTKVVGDSKRSVHVKVVAVGALPGLGESLLVEVRKALGKNKKAPDVLAMLDGIARLEEKARPLGDVLIKLLAHKDPLVRGKAAQACAAVRVPGAVLPMIELLGQERGQLRRRISTALEDFTGKTLGVSKTSWLGWFDKEGRAWVADGSPKKIDRGSGVFAAGREMREQGRYYMGIPQDGEGIVYVIDASESMKKPVKWRKRKSADGGGVTVAGPTGDAPGKGNQTTRLEACKQELIEALSRLERGKRFNVVWYSDVTGAWMPTLQKADPSKIADAIAWVAKLKPIASTNIHDAMKLAFDLDQPNGLNASGKGRSKRRRRQKARGIGVDTIFLLTDGSPTTSDGKLDDPQKVIRAVRAWNPLGRVVVHTIGIGNGLNVEFLSALAGENGGEFKHYDDSGRQR